MAPAICIVIIYASVLVTAFFFEATFFALTKTYGFLTPDMWKETRFVNTPYQEYTDFLAKKSVK